LIPVQEIKLGKKSAPKLNFKYFVLAFIIILYFWILFARRHFLPSDIYDMMFKNAYTFSAIVLIAAISIILISFFVPRFWCHYFCPIGAGSDILLKLETKLLRKV
jgi:polyferredoxin